MTFDLRARSDGGLELTLASQLGLEQPAREEAARLARALGFPEERVEDVKTAVAEAVLNAIEHGNGLDGSRRVRVVLIPMPGGLEIQVGDESSTPFVPTRAQRSAPNVAAMLCARGAAHRGWGLFLMESLADEVEYAAGEQGNRVCLRLSVAGPTPRRAGPPGWSDRP